MTIGKSSRKGSVRAPKFLDKMTGFYGRLDEPETAEKGKREDNVTGVKEGDIVGSCPAIDLYTEAEPGVFEFNQGMMEDNDTLTLLRRKPSFISSRWRRSIRKTLTQTVSASEKTSTEMKTDVPVLEVTTVDVKSHWRRSTRKKKQSEFQVVLGREKDLITDKERGTQSPDLNVLEVETKVQTDVGQREEEEEKLVYPASRVEAEDQVLINDKRGRKEEDVGEEMTLKGQDEMKLLKRSMLKNYRKAFDRAFRQGWENFITNLYSVTLAPVSSSQLSSSATSKQTHQDSVLEEYRVICKQQNIYTVEPMPSSPSSSPSKETHHDSVLKEYRVICPRQ
ncbi:hypothetical protein UPYG_G00234450 [Umbra pygmaea]|uniref:Uncharacterized protein n=1 Tax=Umbra pygmaea TaxID=75934 RepID=A0ABD0WE17_UMBPY